MALSGCISVNQSGTNKDAGEVILGERTQSEPAQRSKVPLVSQVYPVFIIVAYLSFTVLQTRRIRTPSSVSRKVFATYQLHHVRS
jgi:hypothetical protein